MRLDKPGSEQIRVGILEDHQGIIDGYRYRLEREPEISIVMVANNGEDLWRSLENNPIDILLMDINVPTGPENSNPFPVLFTITRLLEQYPDLTVMVITIVNRTAMIRGVLDSGVSAYILKDDQNALRELPRIIRAVMQDGVYLSREVHQRYNQQTPIDAALSPRQLDALSLCAAYPDLKTAQLAKILGVAHSTFRNLLSGAYLQLKVSSRAAAIAEAQRRGLIPPSHPG